MEYGMLGMAQEKTTHKGVDLKSFRSALRTWYEENHRKLPWREAPSLYGTVVSEFMLQQTRVATVLPYYADWMVRFPGFQELADAEEEAVLKAWEGLGYYSRARNLHKLAKVVAGLDEIPRERKSWLKFPGIGPYTSAAITSITFGEPEAVVDGNVVRILARILGEGREFSSSGQAVKAFGETAAAFLCRKDPGNHNQAMMELGATVCLPKNPMCLLCPAQGFCMARSTGDPEAFPDILRKGMQKVVVERALVIEDGKIALYRHPDDSSRLAGLYEIPELKVFDREKGALAMVRKRTIGRQAMEERFYSLQGNVRLPEGCLWAGQAELESLPLSGPHKTWIPALLETHSENQGIAISS